jgi:hypothetical protein
MKEEEEDDIAWGTLQESIPARRLIELIVETEELELEFVTPLQSLEYRAERESITAIRRTPQEIQRNRSLALTRRNQLVARKDKEIYNLFAQLEQVEQTHRKPSIE